MQPEAAQGWAGAEVESGPDQDQFGVYPDNWPVLLVFLAMATQWRWTGGMKPRRCGLEYNSLHVVYGAQGIARKDRHELFRDLQAMETAALGVWGKDEEKR